MGQVGRWLADQFGVAQAPDLASLALRSRVAAARAAACFLLAAGAAVAACSLLLPGFAGVGSIAVPATLAAAAIMVAAGSFCWWAPDRIPDPMWAVSPFLAIALTFGLDMITQDAGGSGQFYFLWPVLFTAMFQSRRMVCLVLGAVFTADAVLVFSLEPAARAAGDLVALIAALTMAAVTIMSLRQRVDTLVAVLEGQARADPLTGLANRRAFAADCDRWVARARRTGEPLALLTVDLDYFKQINDEHGHAAGDAVLRAVADAMRRSVRASDVPARIGGDEFAILLAADRAGALVVAEAVRRTAAAVQGLPGGPPSLSIGVAAMPEDADTVDGLSAASDAALYAAKLNGRNCVSAGLDRRSDPRSDPRPGGPARVSPGPAGPRPYAGRRASQ